MSRDYIVTCYYFPNYHVDPRNEQVHGSGWTEWDLVTRAEPRFAGHEQPKVPLWGAEDESDPAVMARKIAAAADHGIDAFLFDWYWYDDGPFLERGLDRGFLGAPNNDRLQFALMWANHDWQNIHPAKLRTPGPVLYPGRVTPETFVTLTDHVIERYFTHPSYWRIGGCPYFSIYDLTRLLQSFGSVEATRAALDGFRQRTRAAGLPGLHLNAVVWGRTILPAEQAVADPAAIVDALGFDSVASYVWIHHVKLKDFPTTSYAWLAAESAKHWEASQGMFNVPYYPNVTMGWDASPRTVQSDRYLPVGYPFTATLGGNTPEAFRAALQQARDFLAPRAPQDRIFSLNAWNEWTEGSYLEPDTKSGMAYLEAIRDVFGPKEKKTHG